MLLGREDCLCKDERHKVQGVFMNVKSEEKVNLNRFAELTGFPVELIKNELLVDTNQDDINLEDLREAMLQYLNKTMLTE